MKVEEFLFWYKKASKKYAEQFLGKWQREAEKLGRVPEEMVGKFADLYPRGKMLRGALSVLGYQVADGKKTEEMLRASLVMELMETSVLIADDVFDRDERRRGVATIHKQWERLVTSYQLPVTSGDPHFAKASLGARHFGESMAGVTAIAGFHLVPLVLLGLDFSEKAKIKVLEFYYKSLVYTAFGEALDIASSAEKFSDKRLAAEKIHEVKTIWYSTKLPLTFGAILAGAKEGVWLLDLQSYAESLGRIFQIQDDIIGSFGSPACTGKSNTSDIGDSRWTALVEILWKKAGTEDKTILKKIFEKSRKNSLDIKKVKDLMIKYGVVGLARKKTESYLKEGLEIVPKITKDRKYQETLEGLLRFMIERTK